MIEAPQVTCVEHAHPPRAVMIVIETPGIGCATAERLAAHGHLVLIGGPRIDEAEQFAAQLRDRGDSAFAAPLDLADPYSVSDFVGAAHYLIGTPDVLITDAGLAGAAGGGTGGAWVGAQTLATQVIPAMVARGEGDVVLISPELAGVRSAEVHRTFDAWVSALEAEFVGTGVRAAMVRSARPDAVLAAGDAGRLVAAMVTGSRLRLVEVLPGSAVL